MKYSRAYLTQIDQRQAEQVGFDPEFAGVVQDLTQMVQNGIRLSLAEEEFICSKLSIMQQKQDGFVFNIKNIEGCRNSVFRHTYMMYWMNLNGYQPVFDGKKYLSYEERMRDAAMLDRECQRWKSVLEGPPSADNNIESSKVEYQHQLHKLDTYCKNMSIRGFYREYLEKSVALFSLFSYFLATEYCEELGAEQETIIVANRTIVIDSFGYIHILFRHYAEHSKVYQLGKSYHFDENIDYKMIPAFVKDVFAKYNAVVKPKSFHRGITFSFNGKPYGIFCSKYKGNLRLTTFYPIDKPHALEKIKGHKKIPFDSTLTFLMP